MSSREDPIEDIMARWRLLSLQNRGRLMAYIKTLAESQAYISAQDRNLSIDELTTKVRELKHQKADKNLISAYVDLLLEGQVLSKHT